MKDLTHYFHFPTKQKENKILNESVRTLSGVSDETKSQNIFKGLSKPRHVVDMGSSHLSNSVIKGNPSDVGTIAGRTRSKKLNFEVTDDVDNPAESVEHDILSTMDMSASPRTPSRTSGKELCSDTGFSKAASCGKQKVKQKNVNLSSKKTSSCDSRGRSLCLKTEVMHETFTEDSAQEKKRSIFFQRNGIYSPSAKFHLDSLNDEMECSFETGTSDKTSTWKSFDKVPVTSNESTNAFHVLMSSRILQSPRELSPDETEVRMCHDRKKAGTVVAETLKTTLAVKENRKKRKNLEDLAERKRMKKAKHSDCFPEKEERMPLVICKRLVIVPESGSGGERNVGLDQGTDMYKVKDANKRVCRDGSKMFLEENGDKSDSYNESKHDEGVSCDSLTCEKCDATTYRRMDRDGNKLPHKNGRKLTLEEPTDYYSKHQQKQDRGMHQKSLHNDKLSTRKLDGNRSKFVNKNDVKVLVGEGTNGCSEAEKDHLQLKELVVKVERLCTKKCPEYNDSVLKGRRKLVVCEKEQGYGSETTKKEEQKQASISENSKVNCQLSVCNTQTPSQLPTVANMFAPQCSKTLFKCSFQQEVKTLVKKPSNHQGNDKFENDAGENETWIVEDSSEEDNHEKKEFHKEDKNNKAFTVCAIDSNHEMLIEPKKCLPSPDKSKKRNSLFSYFNKVSKDEILFKPEKITVKVQVHSPPVSPSARTRRTSVFKCKREHVRHCGQSKMLELADQIVVLESHDVKPEAIDSASSVTPQMESEEISDLKSPPCSSGWKMRVRLRKLHDQSFSDSETGADSSDDSIFITKKKLVAIETAVKHTAAREQLQNMKTGVTHVNVEQMGNQDDVSLGEAEETTEYSSPCNSSNDVVKLAPLFVQSRGVRKLKVDAAVVEARQNFLKSGFPDSVKKLVDIQRCMEEQCHFIFPSVSHVQQSEAGLHVWSLPLVELPLQTTQTESTAVIFKHTGPLELGTFSNCHRVDSAFTYTKPSPPTPITCYRKLLQMLKLESPDFPIYRHFRRLYSKYILDVAKLRGNVSSKEKKRTAKRIRVSRSNAQIAEKLENCNLNSCVMWTEKYKPTSADDLVGNGHSIHKLKAWLESWKFYSDELQHRDKKGGCKRKDSSSGDEFTDSDTNESSARNLPNNTAILVGPCGCGKTSAVYAVANELGYKVLEINTSSKRNGKRILFELQEATQSHQVKTLSEPASCGLDFFSKGRGSAKSGTVKSKDTGDTTVTKQDEEEHNSRKMSVILVEGVDLVYEDEDGFLSAVTSLVASSKRPVILVTNDPHSPHLSRFMDLHLVLQFSAPSTRRMSIWLQLVCILEGVRMRRAEIERLLDQNCGDVRQTLLQLQFFVLTGGNDFAHTSSSCNNMLSANSPSCNFPALDVADDHSNLSYISGDEPTETTFSVPEHTTCVEVFAEYGEKHFASCQIPFPLNLGRVWWNLASLLSLPESLYQDRICIQSYDDVGGNETVCESRTDSDKIDYVVKVVDSIEMKKKGRDFVGMTVSEQGEKGEVVLVDEVFGKVGNDNNDEFFMERGSGDSESTENSVSELLKVQRMGKNCCSQSEIDCMSRLMDTMSALDIMVSDGGGDSREPSCRSWDQVPKDGMSLNEDAQCHWWEKSVLWILCHYLLESNVHKCRTDFQEAQGCQFGVEGTRLTFTKPTQQELRWRSMQHAAEKTVLPAVALWCHPYHLSLASDYIPMLRAVSRYEHGRLAYNTKRHSRFFHYLKGLNVHASDATLSTLCAVFANGSAV